MIWGPGDITTWIKLGQDTKASGGININNNNLIAMQQ